MKFDPEIHHRSTMRLKGYDYSMTGAYFVTICTHNRECLFGKITDGKIVLNDAGIMIKKWFLELPNKFNDIVLEEYIIMPNHIHCVIQNTGQIVGADLCVCPDNLGEHTGSPLVY